MCITDPVYEGYKFPVFAPTHILLSSCLVQGKSYTDQNEFCAHSCLQGTADQPAESNNTDKYALAGGERTMRRAEVSLTDYSVVPVEKKVLFLLT